MARLHDSRWFYVAYPEKIFRVSKLFLDKQFRCSVRIPTGHCVDSRNACNISFVIVFADIILT